MKKFTEIFFGESKCKKSYTISTQLDQKLDKSNLYNSSISYIRQFLSNYSIPVQFEIKFNTIRNAAYNKDKIASGEIEAELSLKTLSNVKIKASLVVSIRDGKFVEPSTIMLNGSQRIIAQSTFDDLVNRNTFSRWMGRQPEDIASKEMLSFYQTSKTPYVDFGVFPEE